MNPEIEKIKDGVLSTIKGYWREAYDNAPPLAKEYYRINFAASGYILCTMNKDSVPSELEKELYDIYHRLDDESWRYIISMTSGPSKLGLGGIWRRIRLREGKPFPPPKKEVKKEG